MLKSKAHITVMIGAVALVIGSANAHGWLNKPSVVFPNNVDRTQFVATIDSSTSGLLGSFGQSPANNAAAFWTAFKASKYSSIKEFVTELGQIVANGANIECGLTDSNENPQPLPNELEWIHSDTEGFTESHQGPCEAWCDDTRVFQDTNCAAHFTTAPARMPYDKAGCTGASRLTFYWLALHTPTWQVYVNCAVLEGGRGSHSPFQSNSTSGGPTEQSNTPTVSAAVPTTITSPPNATTATSPLATITPTFTAAPTAVAGSGHDDLLNIAGSGQDGEDCEFLDVAGGKNNEVVQDVVGDAGDCGSFAIAGGEEDRGSLNVAGSELDDSLPAASNDQSDPVGTTTDKSTTISESSLNFVNVDGSYISGKVQGPYEK